MRKSIVTLSIDTELIDLAKQSGINISGEVNQFLKSRLLASSLLKDTKSEDLEKKLIETETMIIVIKKQLDQIKNKERIQIDDEKQKKLKELLK